MNKNVTATILIVLAIGIYATFTRAKWADVSAVQKVNDQYAEALKNSDELVKVRDKVLKSYNAITENNKERLAKMIPNGVDNIRLVIDMNDLARSMGLSLKGVKVSAAGIDTAKDSKVKAVPSGDQKISSTVETISISFGVTTSYDNFISLLEILESNLRLMDVKRLTLTATDTGIYDFSVELTAYWLKEQ